MEQRVDFDEWIKTFQPPETRYYAKFDSTGGIVGLYPSSKEIVDDDFIEIKTETALLIQEGQINLHSCFVDLEKKEFGVQKTNLVNGTGPLHRITESKYSQDKNYDIVITINKKNLIVELAKKYGGTKITKEKHATSLKWSPMSQLIFLITDYNDPNVCYDNITITIGELLNNKFVYDLKDLAQSDFSVYTRKIFPNYVIIKK